MGRGHPIPHQHAASTLGAALRNFVEASKLGKVICSPQGVRLRADIIVLPGVLYISSESMKRVSDQEQGASRPIDWVAEILLPGMRTTDEADKLADYARAGIPECWLVGLEKKTIRVYVLGEDGSYTLVETYQPGQVARSQTIAGFEIAVDAVLSDKGASV